MTGLIQHVSEIITSFNTYAKDNQFIAGMLGLYGLGVVSYLFKDIPRKIWSQIVKFSTTTVTMTSANDSFHLFLKWYEVKGHAKKGRYIKISNGRWGDGRMIKSIGYGTHYFFFKWRLIILNLYSKDSVATDKDKDVLTMTMVGRSHKIFDDMFDDVTSSQSSDDKFIIKKFRDGWWTRSCEQRPRKMDTIFLREDIKNRLIKHIDRFVKMEDWYVKAGIPYQTGIILYGPPGTGKTSIIKAVANYLGYQIHILSASSLYKIEDAMFNLPEKSLICIEDIDTNSATSMRERLEVEGPEENGDVVVEDAKSDSPKDPKSIKLMFDFANLSDILNAIDGIQHNHGRILFVTSNHIDKLDKALLRPGRIDITLKIDYVDNYVLKQFFDKFFPGYKFDYMNFAIRDNVPSAEVQNLILENLDDPDNILLKLKRT